MNGLAQLLVQQPAHILGVACLPLVLWLAIKPRRTTMLLAGLAWIGYAAWEWLLQVNSPDANIRIDLLLIWPLLGILTVWALLKPLISCLKRKTPHE